MRRESAIPNTSIEYGQRDGKRAWLGAVFVLVYLSTPALATEVTVVEGQVVRLKLQNVLTTENVVKGDPIKFEVGEDVVVGTHVVIRKGDPAVGKVVAVRGAGKRNAKDASVTFRFESVRSVDSQDIKLRARSEKHKKAESKDYEVEANEPLPGYAERVIGAEKGKDYDAYVDSSVTVRVSDTPVAPPPIAPVAPPPASAAGGTASVPPSVSSAALNAPASAAPEEPAVVDFGSNPPGADVLIDGALVGNTPVKLSVAAGRHLIQLRMGGYNSWTRQMKVEPGSYPSIRATLEKQ